MRTAIVEGYGAEAQILVGSYLSRHCLAKRRVRKSYRHKDLDNHLIKERMKAECRAIVKCRSIGIRTPDLYYVDFDTNTIYMEYFHRRCTMSVKQFLTPTLSPDSLDFILNEIGTNIGKMHANNISHGDLTTSNMLVVHKDGDKDISTCPYWQLFMVFIDFGLAHTECSVEDKGVDLYVLERAFISTHSFSTELFPTILRAYQSEYKNCKEVIAKFEDVRARGRKRTMVG